MATPAITLPAPLTEFLRLSVKTVERGVPLSKFQTFALKSGLPLKELHEVVIPPRTLKHRKARKESLSRDESDKLMRVVRLYDQTVRVFGDAALARKWMSTPKIRFDNRSPLAMLQTEVGGRMVEEMLVQIDEGMFV
jgi:putative toxin-antitoxin system antitoxin component (TIGR02293 family)